MQTWTEEMGPPIPTMVFGPLRWPLTYTVPNSGQASLRHRFWPNKWPKPYPSVPHQYTP